MSVAVDEPQQQVQIRLEVTAAKEDPRQGRKSSSWTQIWGNWKSTRSCTWVLGRGHAGASDIDEGMIWLGCKK